MTNHKRTLQKIDAQLEKISGIVEQLLEDIDISTLNTEQRLNLAIKFMGTWQKGVAIRQTCLVDQPENRENLLIAAFMRQMRGESASTEAYRIIEEHPPEQEEE